jgi:hypothetical protein
MSGFINVVPLVASNTYTPVSPSTDIGNEGDYTLDLNSNILYGPKDSSLTNPWTIGPKLGGNNTWLGSWYAWTSGFVAGTSGTGTFTTGQVVHDSSNSYSLAAGGAPASDNYYVCIKPHTFTVNNVGPWVAGEYYLDFVDSIYSGLPSYYLHSKYSQHKICPIYLSRL